MKKISTETQLYVQLASRGDPTAFYALFHDQIRALYALSRSRGKDHGAACADASKTLGAMYGRFIRRTPGNPQKWFADGCKLRKFDAVASGVAVSVVEAEEYEKVVSAALHRFHCERLERGNDGKGNFKNERPWAPYIIALFMALGAAAFLFYAQSVLTVSFGRFGGEYRVSFPQIAEDIWDMSGLVRAADAEPRPLNLAVPARPAAAEAPGGNE